MLVSGLRVNQTWSFIDMDKSFRGKRSYPDLATFAVTRVPWTPQLFSTYRGGTMANFDEVLRELEQERSRLDQAIRAIGELVGRNRMGAIQTRAGRPRRTV